MYSIWEFWVKVSCKLMLNFNQGPERVLTTCKLSVAACRFSVTLHGPPGRPPPDLAQVIDVYGPVLV